MPHFLLQATYTAQWISGLVSSPEDRGVALRQRVESIGGRVESHYYTFGDTDVVLILDMPDNVTMAALSMAVGASGAVTNIKTTVLIPISEGVEAARKAAGINYRPPGS